MRLNVKFHTFFMFNQGVPLHIQSARACPDAGLISKAASGSRLIIRYSEEKKKKETKCFLLCPPCQADLNDERLNDIPETSQMSNTIFFAPIQSIPAPLRHYLQPSRLLRFIPWVSVLRKAVSADCRLWHRAGN